MTRLLTCGYETGDVAEAGTSTVGSGGALSVVNSTPIPRSSNYCLKVSAVSSSLNNTYKSFSLQAAKTEIWARWAVYLHWASVTAESGIAQAWDPAGAAQTALSFAPADGLLRAYRGAATGTLLATASAAISQDTWHVIEWRIQITSTTAGVVEVYLDGTQVINFSGDVANTSLPSVQTLGLGTPTGALLTSATGLYLGIDDIAVNDTAGTVNNGRIYDGTIMLLKPNGAGSSTQLARGGTDTGANWSQVNEIPASLGQYVSSSTIGQRDLYTLENLGVSVDAINVVEAVALGQNSGAGGGYVAPTLKSGATTNEASAVGLGTSSSFLGARWETDPNTSAAWTASAVDALEAGVTIR